MNDITLRAPGTPLHDLTLAQGRLAVGREPAGGLRVVEDASAARASFCSDRRGTWLVVGEGVRGVHVNGRPVQRKALLRAGDTVYLEGVEILLLGRPLEVHHGEAAQAATPLSEDSPDPRILLRGTSGPHHGRSLVLDRPRIFGSDAAADIRIEPLAPRHAQLAMEGAQAVLRVLVPDAQVRVNGEPCRSAVLQPGDQLAFDAHHRFVLEAPTPVLGAQVDGGDTDDWPLPEREAPAPPRKLRMPWLLLAALLIAGALAALLLL